MRARPSLRQLWKIRAQLIEEAENLGLSFNALIVELLSPSLADDDAQVERSTVQATPDGRLSRGEAARYLGVQPKTLAKWASDGHGPRVTRIGGRRFYRQADLDEFINKEE